MKFELRATSILYREARRGYWDKLWIDLGTRATSEPLVRHFTKI